MDPASEIWLKRKVEFAKIFSLFQELEEAGQTVTLTFASRGASQLSSYSLSPRHHLHHLHLLNPRHQHLANAAAPVALEREPAVTSGQLPTKPPWLRQPQVFHLVILLPHVLSTTYHLLLVNLGGAK